MSTAKHHPVFVIAHRGYWDTVDSAENSLASLQKAQAVGVYGSEFDVWITTDGRLVLNHNVSLMGVNLQKSTYDVVKNLTLKNGEKIATLDSYLEEGKKNRGTKLILEVKTHRRAVNNRRVVAAVLALVKEKNMVDQVEYISFDVGICKDLARLQPGASVAYVYGLKGNKTPAEMHAFNVTGMNYHLEKLRLNKGWIAEAHALGMTVNVWTVNEEADVLEVMADGVDFITTDRPEKVKQLVEKTMRDIEEREKK